MAQQIQEIEVPTLALRHCSTADHCRSLVAMKELPFWWYQDLGSGGPHFSLPFEDNLGGWWYQVRRGYAWPVDAIEAMTANGRRLPLGKSFLAWQHVVPD